MIRSLRFFIGLAACALALPAFAEGPARLVADLAPGNLEAWQAVSDFARVGSRSVFLRVDNDTLALWVTDGTAEGTSPLGVLCPPCGNVELLGSTGSVAFYRASEPYETFDVRIWRTDGTPRGTFPVTGNLKLPQGVPGAPIWFPPSSINGGRLFFAGCSAELGCELWSSDGTPAGTAPVGEIVAGPGSAGIRELAASGDRAFLIVTAADGSSSLWFADGAGRSLTRLRGTPQARLLTAAGAGRAFFIAEAKGLEIWTSDGTAAETRPLTSYSLADPFQQTWFLKFIDGRIYFAAGDGVFGTELWSLGEQPESLRRLTDFREPSVAIGSVEKAGKRIVFQAALRSGTNLWTSRGSLGSTAPLAGCPGGCPVAAGSLENIGQDRLVFYGHNRGGDGFWVTDGSGSGTRLLKRSGRRYDNVQSMAVGGRVLFEIINEYSVGELWITDGSATGTFFVINGGPQWSHYYGFASRLKAGAANGRLVFTARTSETAIEVLWGSDGSPAGTRPLHQALASKGSYPHSLTSFRDGLLIQSCIGNDWELRFLRGAEITRLLGLPFEPCQPQGPTVEAGGAAYFFQYRVEGVSLWRTDGTVAGTAAQVPAEGPEEPIAVTRFGERAAYWLVVSAPNNGLQSQLWRTDGSQAGTQKLIDLPRDVEMYGLTGLGDKLYFFDYERQGTADFAWRPWVSDGTSSGTFPLAAPVDATAPDATYDQLAFTELGGRVFFLLADDHGDVEIWSTDGTPAGTGPAVTAASGMRDPRALSAAGGRLYFAARRAGDPSRRLSPWVSDGTDAGTMPLADVELGTDSFAPLDRPPFVELGDRVYFAASDPVHGEELWATDGTPAGTSLVRDIAPGFLGSHPRSLVVWQDRLYFRARDRTHGMELWTSDGSGQGTRLVQDIAAGASWSTPGELTATGEGLYFSANDGVHGRELWVLPAGALGPDP